MPNFKAKTLIQFRPGLCPRRYWGAYSAPSNLLAEFKAPTSKGGEKKEWEMRGGEGRER